MARMRTLKPEFWDSPSTAQADLAVRLTFLAMWNWADDSGHGTGNLKELEAFAFPNDEVTELPRKSSGNSAGSSGTWRDFSEICGEVAEAYGVVFYRVNGRPYYSIPSFRKHQSKDFREKSRYPKVDEGEIFDVTTGNTIEAAPQQPTLDDSNGDPFAHSSGKSAHPSGEPGLVIGEQGNRVIDIPASDDAQKKTATTSKKKDHNAHNTDLHFKQFWEQYPLKKDKKKAYDSFLKALQIVDLETLIQGAINYTNDSTRDPDHTRHATTWLNNNNWEDSPNVRATPPPQQRFNPNDPSNW